MRNSKFVLLLALVALALAVVALMKTLSLTRQLAGGPEPGNAAPNISPDADVDRVATAAERARMERYVNDLQAAKRVITSFPSVSGETIDCVDVNGQPALKRAGMEGHVLKFAPSTLPQVRDQAATTQKLQVPEQLYGLTGQRCPDRSVPMARLTMDTLKRFRTLDEFFQRKYIDIQKPTGGGSAPSPHQWAHASRSVENWGGESVFNLWSPYVEKSDEFSLSQMWITRGSGANLETVEGGWQVYRDFYGDWRAHLFIYFTPDNYGSGGCYNLSCNAFVQVNNSVYIGGGFTNYSSQNGTQWEFKLLWYKDGTEGDWWLRYGDIWVGYYPRTLFDANGLRNNASAVDFGGEIVNDQTDNRHTRTDMGSGFWPYQGYGSAAYQRAVRYVDTSNFYQQATKLNRIVTNDRCYDLSLSSSSGDWEQYFYFGGSGFNSQCP